MTEGEKRGRLGNGSSNPYFEGRKFTEPTFCPRCGLVYRNGRWQTDTDFDRTSSTSTSHCPACRREMDGIPGGLVMLRGSYFAAHREEILNIVKNQAATAGAHRPLQRIMSTTPVDGGVEIATTNGHLAQRIGKAVESACKGSLSIKHGDGDSLMRLYWERDVS